MSRHPRNWLITSIERGLGRALAQAALARGDRVVGTTRDGRSELDDPALDCLPLDITDEARVHAVVNAAQHRHGRIDVLVNNAGHGLLGAVEETSESETRQIFETNFFGPLSLCQAALPLLREQRSGHIVNVSSVAGLAPMAGSGLYAAAKSALEALSLSLAQELRPLGIHVTLVEPGTFRKDFTVSGAVRRSRQRIADYQPGAALSMRRLADLSGGRLGSPQRCAEVVLAAIDADRPPLQLVLGGEALARVRERQAQLGSDLAGWETPSRSTDSRCATAA